MRFLHAIWQDLTAWFARAVPVTLEAYYGAGGETRPVPVRDSLHEQPVPHWSSHTHF